jgi:hypothetical protein
VARWATGENSCLKRTRLAISLAESSSASCRSSRLGYIARLWKAAFSTTWLTVGLNTLAACLQRRQMATHLTRLTKSQHLSPTFGRPSQIEPHGFNLRRSSPATIISLSPVAGLNIQTSSTCEPVHIENRPAAPNKQDNPQIYCRQPPILIQSSCLPCIHWRPLSWQLTASDAGSTTCASL